LKVKKSSKPTLVETIENRRNSRKSSSQSKIKLQPKNKQPVERVIETLRKTINPPWKKWFGASSSGCRE